jgi:prepilin-type N-terminal cleavage/methylation domain-containing protein
MQAVRRWQRLGRTIEAEGGFTMVELLVVLTILGILLAIAVPSFLGYKDRAADGAAKSNLRAALPSVEAYYSDNSGYAGMTIATLKARYDSAIAPRVSIYGIPTATSYCITDTEGGHAWSVNGPGGGYKNNATCS